ncbi:MarR family transcriptional regulator [Streptomyces sp. NBC_00335]|uniref:MarR family winged helix-turn-helix transcriptional regulator n=1 Tax=unclassified Streptomyces TaxID=2593676 RepID=UPI00225AF8B0|nr:MULTISPECIES: MarR family transcriptional regulator [unclassified Streptomyces]MCX5406476.1 MarR family transcriptional regulator [Streptomyces sp. NBC_00086]
MTETALTDRWVSVARACAQINQAAERVLAENHGLCASAFEIMDVMVREDDWIRAGELSSRVSRSQPQVSRLLAQMITAGYAERRPCATDRRGFDARLTPAGHALFAQSATTMETVLRELAESSAEVRDVMASRPPETAPAP